VIGSLTAEILSPALHAALFDHGAVSRDELIALGARPWQAEFLEPLIAEALEA